MSGGAGAPEAAGVLLGREKEGIGCEGLETLVVVHYHWRTGGVRSVVERGVGAVCGSRWWGGLRRVIFLAGEAPAQDWMGKVQRLVGGVDGAAVVPALEWRVCEGLGYAAEAGCSPAVGVLVEELKKMVPAGSGVWAHNLGLGRNPAAAKALAEVCRSRGAALVVHHHDFWFCHRWPLWEELVGLGWGDAERVAEAVFPSGPGVAHVALTRHDWEGLAGVFGERAVWLPNCYEPPERPSLREMEEARRWLRGGGGCGQDEPVWLLPGRWLRRKNPLEAVLIFLRRVGRGVLVLSGRAGSAREAAFLGRCRQAAACGGWPVRWVDFGGEGAPPFWHLMCAAEGLVQTSVLEGFGLAYVEGTAAGRPLVCRRLRNVWPDLEGWGFRFPLSYEEEWVEPDAAGGPEESKRQRQLMGWVVERLPAGMRELAEEAVREWPCGASEGWAFSRLTLEGQLEVLRSECRGGRVGLVSDVGRWPEGADVLRYESFAEGLGRAFGLARQAEEDLGEGASLAAQRELARRWLRAHWWHPLLWE